MSVQDLRDVLRERAGGPSPANPYRHDEVRARIRRRRRRRRTAAGATAAVAAVTVAVALLPGADEAEPRETTALTRPAAEPSASASASARAERSLPERFTAPDGTRYRRLTTTAITHGGEKRASVTVPVSGLPLDVAGVCDGEFGAATPRFLVNGRNSGSHRFSPCPDGMQLRPLTVPEGAKEVTVTFDTTTVGRGCVFEKKDGPCVPAKERPADWSLGIYEWTPPDRPVTPEPVRTLPDRLGGMKLARLATGRYPADASVEAEVVSRGGKIGIEQLCTGDLADRLWFTFTVDGKPASSTPGCGVWKKGPFPAAMSEFPVPRGRKVRISARIGSWGEHTSRPVNWAIGIYVK
ncbi:hypothetical protein [Nonomuraea candida]|uniref:hypothetical protein n=1 Tax=Nonomuraea candida TaxID=359159 RepID=UPI0005B7713B|nr:hypothetical protein [Nonomuraea candida]